MGKYDKILNLPYPPKDKKSNITPEDRAAQFGPFKALNGFDEAIEDENRALTNESNEEDK